MTKTSKATSKAIALRARGWCLTLNNYSEDEWNTLKDYANTLTQYILGKEVGASGTPHIQGYIYHKEAVSLSTLKELSPRAHWEKAKGNPKQNRNYCSKDGEFIEKWPADKQTAGEKLQARKANFLSKQFKDCVWREWQQSLLQQLQEAPDDRTVYWIYDKDGGQGKSYLAKYLYLTRNVVIADGKKDNIFNQLNKKINEENIEPEIILLDIPRCGKNYMNYGVIEQMKNGLIYSGKYEGGDVIFGPVHVVIFANFQPDYEQFTADRWRVIDISKKEDIDEDIF